MEPRRLDGEDNADEKALVFEQLAAMEPRRLDGEDW